MLTTVTIKLEAESKGELIDNFGGYVSAAKQHFNELLKEGVFGPAEKCALRFLIIGGRVGDESKLDHVRGTPDVE